MGLFIKYLIIILGSIAGAVQATPEEYSRQCGRYFDENPGYHAKFTQMALNDVMFTQNVLRELSTSHFDCSRTCVDIEGCVMYTFQRSETGASGRCQVYWHVHNATQDHEVSPGARSYVLDMEAFGRPYNEYSMKSGLCIRVLKQDRRGPDAAKRCQQLDGGHFLYTKTEEDLQFAYSILRAVAGRYRMWLGATDLEHEGQFQWLDGMPLSNQSSMWAPGEPDNNWDSQHCLSLGGYQQTGKLYDTYCTHPHIHQFMTVCQRDV